MKIRNAARRRAVARRRHKPASGFVPAQHERERDVRQREQSKVVMALHEDACCGQEDAGAEQSPDKKRLQFVRGYRTSTREPSADGDECDHDLTRRARRRRQAARRTRRNASRVNAASRRRRRSTAAGELPERDDVQQPRVERHRQRPTGRRAGRHVDDMSDPEIQRPRQRGESQRGGAPAKVSTVTIPQRPREQRGDDEHAGGVNLRNDGRNGPEAGGVQPGSLSGRSIARESAPRRWAGCSAPRACAGARPPSGSPPPAARRQATGADRRLEGATTRTRRRRPAPAR